MYVDPLRFLQLLCLHDQVFPQSQFQDNCLFSIIRANCKYNCKAKDFGSLLNMNLPYNKSITSSESLPLSFIKLDIGIGAAGPICYAVDCF